MPSTPGSPAPAPKRTTADEVAIAPPRSLASTSTNEIPLEHGLQDRHGEVKKGMFDTPYGRQELTYEEIDGMAVVGGDLILPLPEPDYRGAGMTTFGNMWPNGMVAVDAWGLVDDPKVKDAMAYWEQVTPVRFIRGVTSGPRVRFCRPPVDYPSDTCLSNNGMIGYQAINVGVDCPTGSILHEIGHVLGLYHEHQRPDRGSHVLYNSACLKNAGLASEYALSGFAVGPYDIYSIMHYGSMDLANGCPVLTRLDGTTFGRQRNGLADTDHIAIRSLYLAWFIRQQAVDYDADGLADVATWTPTTGLWEIRGSTGVSWSIGWGQGGDVPVPGYWDTFAGADIAIWRRDTGEWHLRDSYGQDNVFSLGQVGDVPVPADYNGDGQTDLAVWSPTTGQWTISGIGTTAPWGLPTDIPVPADYDGIGRAEFAVYRPSTGEWFVSDSINGGGWVMGWGAPGDIPVPADFDGDGRADIAVWRPSTGEWFVINSSTWIWWSDQWGEPNQRDIPVPGHYNNNGGVAADMAIWRADSGVWWIRNGGSYYTSTLGTVGDAPVP